MLPEIYEILPFVNTVSSLGSVPFTHFYAEKMNFRVPYSHSSVPRNWRNGMKRRDLNQLSDGNVNVVQNLWDASFWKYIFSFRFCSFYSDLHWGKEFWNILYSQFCAEKMKGWQEKARPQSIVRRQSLTSRRPTRRLMSKLLSVYLVGSRGRQKAGKMSQWKILTVVHLLHYQ